MNQKGFSNILLIVVAVVVLVIGGYFVLVNKLGNQNPIVQETPNSNIPTPTQTTNETVGWKTYRNDTLGFEFKYPPNWVIEDVQEERQEPPLYPVKSYIFSLGLRDESLPSESEYDPRVTPNTENLGLGFQLIDSPRNSQTKIEELACPANDPKCISTYKTINGITMLVFTVELEGASPGIVRDVQFKDKNERFYHFYARFYPWQEVSVLATKKIVLDTVTDTFMLTR